MRSFLLHAWDILLRFAGAFTAVLGGGEWRILYGFMALDYLMGLVLALLGKSRKSSHGKFSWKAAIQGFLRKGVMIGIILFAGVMDQWLGQGELLSRAAMGFYICNEGVSLLQNAAWLGVPVPGIIRRSLQAMHTKGLT